MTSPPVATEDLPTPAEVCPYCRSPFTKRRITHAGRRYTDRFACGTGMVESQASGSTTYYGQRCLPAHPGPAHMSTQAAAMTAPDAQRAGTWTRPRSSSACRRTSLARL